MVEDFQIECDATGMLVTQSPSPSPSRSRSRTRTHRGGYTDRHILLGIIIIAQVLAAVTAMMVVGTSVMVRGSRSFGPSLYRSSSTSTNNGCFRRMVARAVGDDVTHNAANALRRRHLSMMQSADKAGGASMTRPLISILRSKNVFKKSLGTTTPNSDRTPQNHTQSSQRTTDSPTQRDETFLTQLKEFRKTNSFKKLVKMVKDHSAQNNLSLNMTVMTLKTLQVMNRTELGSEIFQHFSSSHGNDTTILSEKLKENPQLTLSLVKWYCKEGYLTISEKILELLGFTISYASPEQPNKIDLLPFLQDQISTSSGNFSDMKLFYRGFVADILSQLCMGYTTVNHFQHVLMCLDTLSHYNLTLDNDLSKKILKHFLKMSTSFYIQKVVEKMLQSNALVDQDALQMITNTYVKSIAFVKGSVSMETLPPLKHAEVCFIGRSNVGKSSLINALTNRKGLAYTSKTAGKTSEFNYFEVNGTVGVNKEEKSFYLVDLPGVGYAERSKNTRWGWQQLLKIYSQERSSLRAIYHLVDSRHGLLDADYECLNLIETLPEYVEYIVVFTKVDKLRMTLNQDVPISEGILRNTQRKLQEKFALNPFKSDKNITILYSSSHTKQGALDVLMNIIHLIG